MTTTERGPGTLESPYKGLLPYSEDDSDRFFGRESECALIISNLRARRLTLLYGESGVGKSSLLRAGVARELRDEARREQAERGKARFVPVIFDDWRDDPVGALIAAVADQAAEFLPDAAEPPDPQQRLDEALERWSKRLDAKLLLVLDQFEEYFLYHPAEDGEGTIVEELPMALMRSDVRANFLISMREDALAKLDGFRSRIPDLMGNRLRIRHLDRPSARAAIEKPIDYHNRLYGVSMSIEPALVEAVLDQVEAGKVQLDGGGLGEIARGDGQPEGRIEAPYLQLVLERLWDVEMEAGSTTLRLETLERLGGSQTIVRTHLDEVMGRLVSERQNEAAEVFRYLVTRGGTKIAYTAGDLAELVGRSEPDVQEVLKELDDVRILRTVDGEDRAAARYEIFHDVLAAAVLDWRQRHDEARRLERERREQEEALKRERREREEALERERREREEAERQTREAREAERREHMRARRFKALLIAAGLFSLLAAGALAVAVLQWNEANREKKEQASAAVGRRAADLLAIRPDVAMLAALEAYRLTERFEARDAVLTGLHENPSLPALLVGHFRAVQAVAFSPSSDLLASVGSDGALRLWEVTSARPRGTRVIAPDAVVQEVAFVDEDTLVTADDEGFVRLWNVTDSGKSIARGPAVQAGTRPQCGEPEDPTNCEIRSIALSVGGILAVGREDGRIRFWRVGEKFEKLPREGRAGEQLWSLAFSPDGAKLASAESVSDEEGAVTLWDVSRLTSTAPRRGTTVPQAGADSVAFRAGGKMLAAGSDDGRVVLLKVDGQRLQRTRALAGHIDAVWALAFSRDGSVLATAGDDNAVVLWDVRRRLPFGGPRTHTDDVNGLAVSPDGKTVASGGADGAVKLWRVDGRSLATTLGTADDTNRDLAVGSESTLAVAGKSLRHWNLAQITPGRSTGDSQRRLLPGRELRENTWDVAFAGDVLAAVTAKNVALGLFPDPGKLPWRKLKVGAEAVSVALEPTKRTAAVGTDDGKVTLWNVSDPADPESLDSLPRAHRASVSEIIFNPSGNVLATAGENGTIRLWDVRDPERVTPLGKPLVGHDRYAVLSLAFSPDGRKLASGGRDQRIALWDVTDPSKAERDNLPVQQQTNTILALAFSRDGELLAAGDGDGDVVFWDVASSETLGGDLAAHTPGEVGENDDSALDALEFDGRGYLISAGRNVPVVVWSPELWTDDYETLRKNVCAIVRRPLGEAEWRHFFGGTPFEDEKPEACVDRGR